MLFLVALQTESGQSRWDPPRGRGGRGAEEWNPREEGKRVCAFPLGLSTRKEPKALEGWDTAV